MGRSMALPGCGRHTDTVTEKAMDLVALAKNPVPSGAQTGYFNGHDGRRLRFARWRPTRGPQRGTVCVFQGRSEYIEKYFEVVADLRRRGFAVATMDWRGQGGSERLLSNPRKGHVRSFTDYDRDLAAFMKEIVLPDCQPPFVALAHSMGGHILLRNAVLSGSWFSRMVLAAPMIAIAPEQLGYPPPLPRAYAEIVCALGLGRIYAPGGSDDPIEMEPFQGNCLTSDAERYARNRMVVEAAPRLGVGAPTVRWLRAALRSIARLTAPDYPSQVRVPLLLFAAGMDRVVSTTHIEELGLRLKVGTHVLIPQARHEILQETDDVRKDFWAAFDSYLGVDAPAA
jgi:lysophospholipase